MKEAASCRAIPLDADDPVPLETLERLWEGKVTRAFSFHESNHAKISPGVGLLNRHHAIIFQEHLKMAIAFRLLPQSMNFGSAAFLDNLVEACGLRGQEFHRTLALPVREKKSARELRQSGSDYRCCIPALAGFVSPQSIAPDGRETSRRPARTQLPFTEAGCGGYLPLKINRTACSI